MSYEWPVVGPACEIDGFIEPMTWGSSTYTVIRIPDALVASARTAGTRRVGGELDGVAVNLALTKAPVMDSTFVWAGSSLLRRMRLEVGEPVHGSLAPVDPDYVLVPADLADAILQNGQSDAWDSLPPPLAVADSCRSNQPAPRRHEPGVSRHWSMRWRGADRRDHDARYRRAGPPAVHPPHARVAVAPYCGWPGSTRASWPSIASGSGPAGIRMRWSAPAASSCVRRARAASGVPTTAS